MNEAGSSPRIKKLIPILATVAVALTVLLVIVPREIRRAYPRSIEAHRASIDTFMQTDASPFLPAERSRFTGLSYFPVDLAYRVPAILVPIKEDRSMGLLNTAGYEEEYIRHAWADFEYGGETYRVLLLKSSTEAANRLFLAFNDATNGDETYLGGRYVDVFEEPGEAGTVIDFNRAYNPYCVYDPSFVCPVPPIENRLSFEVRAGEKLYPEPVR